ncbi:hypothetical protein [Sphingomonas sp. ID0503]|uniref:hypothetical protein n=1 Tax=Sphingomonas sp. ID0503 TaxID=3399691 RepID=UPI003AFA2817
MTNNHSLKSSLLAQGTALADRELLAGLPTRPVIVVVNGDKGGVGKSFGARVAAGLLHRSGVNVHGFDCDARNAHLDRYYSSSFPVTRVQLRRESGLEALFDRIEGHPDALALVDLPANIGDVIEREMPRLISVADALKRPIIHVWVADEEYDSITLLKRVQHLAPPTHTLIVLNGRFAASPREFRLWQESDVRAELIAGGARETFLPVLPIRARTRIDRARSPFHDVSAAGLQTWEKVDFNMWWSAAAHAFAPLLQMVKESK